MHHKVLLPAQVSAASRPDDAMNGPDSPVMTDFGVPLEPGFGPPFALTQPGLAIASYQTVRACRNLLPNNATFAQ
jgi:hypothetical protein